MVATAAAEASTAVAITEDTAEDHGVTDTGVIAGIQDGDRTDITVTMTIASRSLTSLDRIPRVPIHHVRRSTLSCTSRKGLRFGSFNSRR